MLFIDLLATSGHWVAALHLKLNVYHHSGRRKFFFLSFAIQIYDLSYFLYLLDLSSLKQSSFGKPLHSFAVSASCSWVLCWHLIADCWSDVCHKHQTDLRCWHFYLSFAFLISDADPDPDPQCSLQKTTTTKNSGLRTVNLWCTGLLKLSDVEICIWDSKTRNLSTR